MKSSFNFVFDQLIGHEGGYVNDPDDPGGPTKFGVTLATLRAYRRDQSLDEGAVKRLTLKEAQEIFRNRYWDTVRADQLPPGVDYSLVDFAYNSGPGQAVKTLQRLLGVRVDGVVAPFTLNAIAQQDPRRLIDELCDARLSFMKKLAGWWKYGRGWKRRVDMVRQQSLTLAGKAKPQIALLEPGELGAKQSLFRIPQVQGSAFAGGGVGLASVAEQTKSAGDQLSTLEYLWSWAPIVGGVLVAIGIGLTFYASFQSKEETDPR